MFIFFLERFDVRYLNEKVCIQYYIVCFVNEGTSGIQKDTTALMFFDKNINKKYINKLYIMISIWNTKSIQ